MAPQDFRAQMELVRLHYRPMSLEALSTAARSSRLPQRAVAITIDDGYLDAFVTVSPILMKLGIPATFFVHTDRLHEEHETLWDTLDRIFSSNLELPRTLDLEIGRCRIRYATTTSEERGAARDRISSELFSLVAPERVSAMRRLVEWSGHQLLPRDTHRRMTASEVVQLGLRPGHTIGAHTVHHLYMPALDQATQQEEIMGSKLFLEGALDCTVTTFSYPYGKFDSATVALVRAALFQVGVTCRAAPVVPSSNPLLLPRLEVKTADPVQFKCVLDDLLSS